MKRCIQALAAGAVALGFLTLAAPAGAQAIVTNGAGLAIGITETGAMNVPAGIAADGVTSVTPLNSTYVGLSFRTDYSTAVLNSDGFPAGLEWGDATSPGCLCEGFGVSAVAGPFTHVGYDGNGFANLSVVVPGGTVTGGGTEIATLVALTDLPGLTVKHEYKPSASPSLYEAVVTITNATGGPLTDVRYRRVMDWDVPPTTFSELVTISGALTGDLIESCDNGFEPADPTLPCLELVLGTTNVDFVDNGPTDHGALFTFGFGALADTASKMFSIFYGAAPSEAAALAALAAVSADTIYSFGQPAMGGAGSPATFIFGFKGVGAPSVPPPGDDPIDPPEPPEPTTVPEPAMLLLVGAGLAGAARRYRRV